MVKLVFLGTSGQIPTKERNHTSILLETEKESLLIDCGEGTQRQIRKAGLNINKINKILLTHWHGDHSIGLIGLLETINFNDHNSDIFIYGPKGIKKFVKNLLKTFEFEPNFKLIIKEVNRKFFENEEYCLYAETMTHSIPCNSYSFQKKDQIKIYKDKLEKTELKGEIIKKLKEGKDIVFNKKHYYAKDLTYTEKGKKISFVLDTSFNKKIIPFVKNSDVLICESTFGDDLENKAKEYFHLTLGQALKIAKESNSKKIYLIHISQRYEKTMNSLISNAKKIFKESYFPKDLEILSI